MLKKICIMTVAIISAIPAVCAHTIQKTIGNNKLTIEWDDSFADASFQQRESFKETPEYEASTCSQLSDQDFSKHLHEIGKCKMVLE